MLTYLRSSQVDASIEFQMKTSLNFHMMKLGLILVMKSPATVFSKIQYGKNVEKSGMVLIGEK